MISIRSIRRGAVFLLLFALLCTGCSNHENVRLCNYRNMSIPDEVLTVSGEDVQFAIQMKLAEKNALVPKSGVPLIVEDGDVVSLQIAEDGKISKAITITVGNEDFMEGFDKAIIGKHQHETFFFQNGENKYTCQVTDISTLAETVTDKLANAYFDCTSVGEVIRITREEIVEHRVFDYMYSYLLNNSMIRGTKERNAYIQRSVDQITSDAERNGCSLDVYLESVLGTSLQAYKQMAGVFYDEYLILEALIHQEGIVFSDEEFESYLRIFSEDLGMDTDDVLFSYGEEVIRYIMYYEESYSILLQYAER